MNAAILSIGDELTLGQNLDTNSAWLSAKLVEHGVAPTLHMTVADDQPMLVDALRYAAERANLLLVTGGLGPTDDDLTRQAVAEFLGCGLEPSPIAMKQIEAYFEKLGRTMAEKNRIQALCPTLAKPLENPAGTAPGIFARYGQCSLYCVPGVPGEMRAMYELHIVPHLASCRNESPRFIQTAKLNAFGTGESVIAEMLGPLMDRHRNPLVGTTVSQGVISVRIRSESNDRAEGLRALDDTIAQVRRKLGRYLFGTDDQTLADAVGQLLHSKKRTACTAESCTGGLIGKMLTDVSGSSGYYACGWVVYSNEAKTRELNVAREIIEAHGAVSEQVAVALADHARNKSGADYALSVTGVAGPTGGSQDKPVGTVWIGLAERDRASTAQRFQFPGHRQDIRDRAAKTALDMLRLRLQE